MLIDAIIDVEASKFKFFNTLRYKTNKTKGIPLVIMYHPMLTDFVKVINKQLHLLYTNDEVKKTFTLRSMISFGGARKLSSISVRANLYPLERLVGSFKNNGKRYQVCLNVTESNTLSSSADKSGYVINHSLTQWQMHYVLAHL